MRPTLIIGFLLLIQALVGCGEEVGQADTAAQSDGVGLGPTGGAAGQDPANALLPDAVPRALEVCDEAALSALAPCADAPGTNGATILRGTVLSADGLICDGEVLMEGGPGSAEPGGGPGQILCVGPTCAEHPKYGGAARICAPVILPGLIDAHNHMSYNTLPSWTGGDRSFTHRDQWRGLVGGDLYDARPPRSDPVAARYNEMRLLMGGVTAVHKSERVRACYDHVRNLDRGPDAHGLGYQDGDFTECVFPLTQNCDAPNYSRNQDVPSRAYAAHVAEGTDEEARAEFDRFASEGQLGPTTAVIHCVACKGPELNTLREAEGYLVWSPRSNTNLYGVTTDVAAALNLGIKVAMGSDWTPSGSLTMLDELACGRELSDRYMASRLSGRDLVLMTTHHAADAMGVEDFIGRLAPGKVADITVVQGDRGRPYDAVTKARPQDVRAVFIGGALYYGDESVFDPSIARNAFCEAVDVCGTPKTLCLRDEGQVASGLDKEQWPYFSLAEMQAYLGSILAQNAQENPGNPPYAFELAALFSCAAPEPCRFGNSRFSGDPTAEDPDADGLLGSGDNCVDVFNPDQGDLDGDGAGDSCDRCPLLADSNECDPRAPTDSDMDGIEDGVDVCPRVMDPAQTDGDGDGIGDACDPCPTLVSSSACPVSIDQFKQPDLPQEGLYALSGVVTGVFPADHPSLAGSFVIQNEGSAVGDFFQGVFIYMGDAVMGLSTPQSGDRVRVEGRVHEYSGQTQVALVETVNIEGQGAVPGPSLLSVAEATAQFDSWEAMLVCVGDVVVTTVQLDPDDERRGGFMVRDANGTAEFFVGESLFASAAPATMGDAFRQICGILFLRSGQRQLLPRQALDLERGMPVVESIGPDRTYLRAGRSGIPLSVSGDPLTIKLDRPAESGGLRVFMATSAAELTVPAELFIAEGRLESTVTVDAVSPVTGASLTVRTEAQQSGPSTTIDVYGQNADASAILFDAPRYLLSPNSEVSVIIRFDAPLLNGIRLNTNLAQLAELSGPTSLILDADALGVVLPIQSGSNNGVHVLEIEAGLLRASVEIEVSDQPPQMVINEINADLEGVESTEFVELYNAGGQPAPLTDARLELLNGANGQVYESIDLATAGPSLDPGQYLVVGDAEVAMLVPNTILFVAWESRGDHHDVQNGPDGVRVVSGTTVLDSVAYGGSSEDFQEGPRPAPEDPGRGDERTLSRCPNGVDQDDNGGDFTVNVPSPGAANSCP